IWDVDWSTVSWHSGDPSRMERMLRAWDRHLIHPSLPRTLAPALRRAGFVDVRADGHVFSTIDLDREAYGGMAIRMIETYAAGLAAVGSGAAKAWADEQRALGVSGEFFFTVTQFCFTAARPA